MHQQAYSRYALGHILQHRIREFAGFALNEPHGLSKRQHAHHVVAIVHAHIVDDDRLSNVLSDPGQELVSVFFYPWSKAGECYSSC